MAFTYLRFFVKNRLLISGDLKLLREPRYLPSLSLGAVAGCRSLVPDR